MSTPQTVFPIIGFPDPSISHNAAPDGSTGSLVNEPPYIDVPLASQVGGLLFGYAASAITAYQAVGVDVLGNANPLTTTLANAGCAVCVAPIAVASGDYASFQTSGIFSVNAANGTLGNLPVYTTAVPGVLSESGAGTPGAGSPPMGTSAPYSVLAGTTITNSGPTVINGGLGLSPGSSVTGAPTVLGSYQVDTPAAVQAKTDLTTAYNFAQSATPATVLSATTYELGSTTLTPGIYSIGTAATITGTLTLNGAGVYIIQIGSSLTAEASSVVLLTGGATAVNVTFAVGSSATITAGSTFVGTILALTSISVGTGSTINGRLLAQNGAVTFLSDTVIGGGASGALGPNDSAGGTRVHNVRFTAANVSGGVVATPAFSMKQMDV